MHSLIKRLVLENINRRSQVIGRRFGRSGVGRQHILMMEQDVPVQTIDRQQHVIALSAGDTGSG